jgi:hypothetical protein
MPVIGLAPLFLTNTAGKSRFAVTTGRKEIWLEEGYSWEKKNV